MDRNYDVESFFDQINKYKVLIVDFLGATFLMNFFEDDIALSTTDQRTVEHQWGDKLFYPSEIVCELIKLAVKREKRIYIIIAL